MKSGTMVQIGSKFGMDCLGRIAKAIVRLFAAGSVMIQVSAAFAIGHPGPWAMDAPPDGTVEGFRKWTNVLEHHPADMDLLDGPCDASEFNACHLRDWMDFLDSIRQFDRREQLDRVNRHFNASPYITDMINWNMPDYWARPLQFLDRSGDCEDYAIIKYYSLIYLGFSKEDLRIVVLHDNNLNVGHAVLTVSLSGQILALDNQIDQVASVDLLNHYTPIFSVNERHWWRHG